MDAASGELLWRSRTPGDGFLVALDGQLAVLTKEGSLHLGEASPEGWQETTRIEVFEMIPDSAITAISVVPPPMSMTMLPVGVSTGSPTPIAAAIGSSTM